MKNIRGILIAVFVVVVLILTGLVTYQATFGTSKAAEQQSILKQYNFPGNGAAGTVPKSGFGKDTAGTAGASGTVSQGNSDVNGMLQELDQTKNDSAATDVQDLQTQVNGL